jgi:hypothetical protein
MVNSKEKLSTRRGVYFLQEAREHLDYVSFGSLKLKSGARQSVGFSDKSNRFKVVNAPEDGKYKVGQYVWGHHFIYKNPVAFLKDTFATLETNIWFAGQSPTTPENLDEELVIFKPYEEPEMASNGIIYQLKKENAKAGTVLIGMEKNATITFIINKEYEMFYGEERFFVVDRKWITSVNGEPYGEYYLCDYMEHTEHYRGGILYYGQAGVRLKYGFDSVNGFIAKLYNPKLPLHGKVAILDKKGEYSRVSEGRGIVAVLS